MNKVGGIILAGIILTGCTSNSSVAVKEEPVAAEIPVASPTAQISLPKEKIMNTATITTSKGEITVKLYPDSAPKTVANFANKAVSKFYEGLTWHRVEDWVIQGGDPLGTGTGGGDMPTELSSVPFKVGSLGVARGGNKAISNDSQFFICTTDCAWLTGEYTNFGEVTKGMDVAKQISVGDKIVKVTLVDE